MALKRNALLDRLDNLREEIRKEVLEKKGIEPVVCTDSALKEITNKRPLKISDFMAISGLEKDFMSLYADRFLNEILTYEQSLTKEVQVSKTAHKVLHNYKDRLTNISKSNPNLYMGRVENIKSFDLTSLNIDEEIINFLINPKNKKIKISFPNELINNRMTTLYRETNKAFKETGSYNLYIAYPYVEGVFTKEHFPIKAPLIYFPVKFERNKRDITLVKDNEKDLIFNRDLLLAVSKVESGTLDSKMPSIENFNEEILRDIIFKFYESNGTPIHNKPSSISFEPFQNELKEDFVKREHTNFTLKSYITLGRYQPYSSMIQKDMDTILSNHKYNELLEGLIDEANLYKKEAKGIYTGNQGSVKENKISYINELNDSQEKVIELLNTEKKLVIWGPPGTGKSQTITSLIASSILKGENVLVVSEKKVALDVIYSRLKGASRYAMFIDDAENKQNFYTKLQGFLDPMPPVRTRNNDIYHLEEEINELTTTLDNSLRLLYGEKIDEDVTISGLYSKYLKDKDVLSDLTPLKIYQMFERNFDNFTFKDIDKLERTFSKDKELIEYLEFEKMITKYPILLKLDLKISRSGKIELESFDNDFKNYLENSKNKGFFGRRKLNKEFFTQNSLRLKFMTIKNSIDKKYLKEIKHNPELNTYVVENTLRLDKYLTKHKKLSVTERRYLKMLLNDELVKDLDDITKYRSYLFNAYYTGLIEDFKARNQKHLYIIDDYQSKMEKLESLISEKMQVTIESFEMALYRYALNFSNTKRIMDIKRTLEQTQKPSIKAFIDIFQPEMMENIRVWMMTPEVVSAVMPLRYGMFDLVIFDEASQMYVEKGIPAIYRAKKVVIAGDPKQLRPSSLGIGRIQDEDELFEEDTLKDASLDAKSLLDLARYKYTETLLNYHYRSEYEELISFSNHAFYDGKLIVSPNQTQSVKPPIEYVYVEDGVFEDRKNHREALEVVDLIKKIFRQRKNNETIGVITFNSSQRDLIENYIDKELFNKSTYQRKFEQEMFRTEDGEDKSLFVKNIENVQGDERDIIIFSMGYAKDDSGSVKRRFGWLNHEGGENRLNVAVTRAKKKIYFVSSLYPEELKVEDLTSRGPKLLKDFMRYCYYVSSKKHDSVKLILNSLNATEVQTQETIMTQLAEEIKQRLERNKYEVHSSIGIGKYNISLGIYDKDTDSYKLGIICDIASPDNINARKDLLHQERYLKSRKWNVYRIFASNWYTDPNKELRNIREALKKN